MRIDRFRTYLGDLLRESGNPDVASVDTYTVPGNEVPMSDLKVTGSDGTAIYLRIVRTSSPDDGRQGPEEQIVTKTERGVQLITGE